MHIQIPEQKYIKDDIITYKFYLEPLSVFPNKFSFYYTTITLYY